MHKASKHQEKKTLHPENHFAAGLMSAVHTCPSFVSPADRDSTQKVILASVSTNAHSDLQPVVIVFFVSSDSGTTKCEGMKADLGFEIRHQSRKQIRK